MTTPFKRSRRELIGALGAAALGPALPRLATAQSTDWPRRPIRLVIPVTPGGVYDAQGRFVAERLANVLGQPVIVENRPGAENRLGTAAVAKAAPDGYTLLMCGTSMVQHVAFSKDLPYRLSELTALGMCCWLPFGFGINAAVPAGTLQEFVQLAKSRPGTFSYGSLAVSTRAVGETFGKAAGISLNHVPYKGEAPLSTDLLAGHVQTGIMTSGGFRQWYGTADKVKWLAVTTANRMTRFPAVPTFVESGYPAVDMSGWLGFMAPTGTPAEIVARLSTELARITASADFQNRVLDLGVEPNSLDGPRFAAFLDDELRKWQRVQRETGIEA
jgi:tripartite-type tricarboxylate transporter receptor subunit TctC